MKALFEINGRTIYVESDPTITSDTTVKVRSLDSFAQLLQGLENNGDIPTAVGKNGKETRVKRRAMDRRTVAKKAAALELVREKGIPVAPRPEGGFRTPQGGRIILGNYGVSREEVAIAVSQKSNLLTDHQLQLLALRFGIGEIKRPHNTEEIAAILYPSLKGTLSGQAQVSKDVYLTLKRIGLRPKHRKAK